MLKEQCANTILAEHILRMAADKGKASNVRANRQAGRVIKTAEIVNYPGKRNVANTKLDCGCPSHNLQP
jgi:hypothetical protein